MANNTTPDEGATQPRSISIDWPTIDRVARRLGLRIRYYCRRTWPDGGQPPEPAKLLIEFVGWRRG